MSVTTTANPVAQSVLRVLADYELTHSDHENTEPENIGTLNPRSQVAETRPNPDGWTDDYNGVPPYRPINYQLDREERPWAQPGIETAFVWTMLNGVGCVSVCRTLRLLLREHPLTVDFSSILPNCGGEQAED